MRIALAFTVAVLGLTGCSTIPGPDLGLGVDQGPKVQGVIAVPSAARSVASLDSTIRVPQAPLTGVPADNSASKSLRSLMGCEGELRYTAVLPIEASDYTRTTLVQGKPKLERVQFDVSKPKEVNKALPNLSMGIGVTEFDVEGQAAFVKGRLYHRQIVMDFAKSRIEPITDQNDAFYGYGRVGAGLRLIIDLWTTESSFDGSLVGLAAGVKAGTLRGRLAAESIGIDNPDVTLSMPWSADLSEGSIQKAIESMAVIKSRIHDTSGNTTLIPHVLARVSCIPPAQAKK